MAATDSSGASKKRPVKKKPAKKKAATKKKAVARKSLSDLEVGEISLPEESTLEVSEGILEVDDSSSALPSVTAVQETITTRATRNVRHRDITVFLRQLIMLLEAGTPILKSLKTLATRGEHKGIRNLITGISEYVEAGNPLWQAFAREGKHFSPVYINLIKAAEASGSLTTVLRRLVVYREKREFLRRQMMNALIYPVSIAVIAYIIIYLLSTFLIPEFRAMFAEFDAPLNGFTKFVLDAAAVVGGSSSLVVVIVAVVGTWLLYTQVWLRSPVRRAASDRLKFRIPVIGGLTRSSVVAEFTRTFAMLQRSGVLMMSTLELCRNSMSNRAFAGAIQDMRDSVERGDGLEGPLRDAEKKGLIPGVVVDMLITGEETGSMDNIADQIADSYEQEVQLLVSGLKEAIQPIMVVAIGLVVGGIVVAMFLPLVSLMTGIAEGGGM